MDNANTKSGWKQRAVHELSGYLVNFVYLAVFFTAFAWYRRLILAEYHITYLHYGAAVIEALILAKVIMLGDIMNLGRQLGERPLALIVLYQAVVFTAWVAVFGVLEHTIDGLVREKGLAWGVREVLSDGRDELLARCLIMFVAFMPFFAFRELGRVLGEGKIRDLFFRRRAA